MRCRKNESLCDLWRDERNSYLYKWSDCTLTATRGYVYYGLTVARTGTLHTTRTVVQVQVHFTLLVKVHFTLYTLHYTLHFWLYTTVRSDYTLQSGSQLGQVIMPCVFPCIFPFFPCILRKEGCAAKRPKSPARPNCLLLNNRLLESAHATRLP
jgi:hypothetical protein